VPHLGAAAPSFARHATISVRFAPPAPVAGAPFRPVGAAATRPLLRPGESLC
jgi:hypothetical protein